MLIHPPYEISSEWKWKAYWMEEEDKVVSLLGRHMCPWRPESRPSEPGCGAVPSHQPATHPRPTGVTVPSDLIP
ncbi:hypothetical protein E2C01_058612 [Portunus trituberculatus]|uniref:Uncharacterized protein n=1 Tax=Portunus trituberculatus TaxID=210409 RepID=A0A5B7H4E8_PORTR|nr:hypothetical protein [Portunus trituberculatus]